MIWCTNHPNIHILWKGWSFIRGCFFPVSILNKNNFIKNIKTKVLAKKEEVKAENYKTCVYAWFIAIILSQLNEGYCCFTYFVFWIKCGRSLVNWWSQKYFPKFTYVLFSLIKYFNKVKMRLKQFSFFCLCQWYLFTKINFLGFFRSFNIFK